MNKYILYWQDNKIITIKKIGTSTEVSESKYGYYLLRNGIGMSYRHIEILSEDNIELLSKCINKDIIPYELMMYLREKKLERILE